MDYTAPKGVNLGMGAQLTITFSDPGMYDRTLSVTSWDALAALLEQQGRHYTLACVAEGPRVLGWASREVGERNWIVWRCASSEEA